MSDRSFFNMSMESERTSLVTSLKRKLNDIKRYLLCWETVINRSKTICYSWTS